MYRADSAFFLARVRVAAPAPRAAMALAALSGDEQCIIFSQLCNVLDPGVAVAFSSTNSELRVLTQAQRQQLRADHDHTRLPQRWAARWERNAGSCKELREAKVLWFYAPA
eukprot:scaffold131973_cov72-Phaeocystis_antarctica.AAC.1